MKELLKDLKAVLEKHGAIIVLEEDEGFLDLNLEKGSQTFILDSGYRDLLISPETIEIYLKKLKNDNSEH